jgi:hypothetical protein
MAFGEADFLLSWTEQVHNTLSRLSRRKSEQVYLYHYDDSEERNGKQFLVDFLTYTVCHVQRINLNCVNYVRELYHFIWTVQLYGQRNGEEAPPVLTLKISHCLCLIIGAVFVYHFYFKQSNFVCCCWCANEWCSNAITSYICWCGADL